MCVEWIVRTSRMRRPGVTAAYVTNDTRQSPPRPTSHTSQTFSTRSLSRDQNSAFLLLHRLRFFMPHSVSVVPLRLPWQSFLTPTLHGKAVQIRVESCVKWTGYHTPVIQPVTNHNLQWFDTRKNVKDLF